MIYKSWLGKEKFTAFQKFNRHIHKSVFISAFYKNVSCPLQQQAVKNMTFGYFYWFTELFSYKKMKIKVQSQLLEKNYD